MAKKNIIEPKQRVSQLEADYREIGYTSHFSQIIADGLNIDQGKMCTKCKTPHLRYIGLQKTNYDVKTIVAIAICDNCGDEDEF